LSLRYVGNFEIQLLRPIGPFVAGTTQGFFWTKVFSRAFWSATGMSPSSTSFERSSIITSEGFTSLGHRMVQAPQDVQYHGRASSTTDWNCFLRTSILTLKGVLPDSGQLPAHLPHWMHVNTLVADCSAIICNPRWRFDLYDEGSSYYDASLYAMRIPKNEAGTHPIIIIC